MATLRKNTSNDHDIIHQQQALKVGMPVVICSLCSTVRIMKKLEKLNNQQNRNSPVSNQVLSANIPDVAYD